MTARERILAIKLLEKQERNPNYAQAIGIHVRMANRNLKDKENAEVKGGK
jgi:hypothetical protein